MRRKMSRSVGGRGPGRRRGAALVELAITLPVLAFILIASTDFARVYHDYVTITDCSRNGALYASMNPGQSGAILQSGISAASLADVKGLSPPPTVTTASGSLGQSNQYVDVTVSYDFKTLISCPGIPSTVSLGVTTRMRVAPLSYRMQ